MPDAGFAHLVRAVLALALVAVLPVLLWVDVTTDAQVLQTYQDALAAVVAFYFGTTSQPAP